jgi:hypothetical protein
MLDQIDRRLDRAYDAAGARIMGTRIVSEFQDFADYFTGCANEWRHGVAQMFGYLVVQISVYAFVTYGLSVTLQGAALALAILALTAVSGPVMLAMAGGIIRADRRQPGEYRLVVDRLVHRIGRELRATKESFLSLVDAWLKLMVTFVPMGIPAVILDTLFHNGALSLIGFIAGAVIWLRIAAGLGIGIFGD